MKTLSELTDKQLNKILNLRENKFSVEFISNRFKVDEKQLKDLFDYLDNHCS